MNDSSTKYLDSLITDDYHKITRDVVNEVRDYLGSFGFVLGICNIKGIDDTVRAKIIKDALQASLSFMAKKYEMNLSLYKEQALDNTNSSSLSDALLRVPAKMQKDYRLGIEQAHTLLVEELNDILKYLGKDLSI